MDPATTFCPNLACPARGQTGQGNIRSHSCKDQRFLCTECHKTFSATPGTALYRLRTSAETVSLVVTLLAHGWPLHAIVVAFGSDERTVAGWGARAGIHGQGVQEHLVEPPRALGQVQVDEIQSKNRAVLSGWPWRSWSVPACGWAAKSASHGTGRGSDACLSACGAVRPIVPCWCVAMAWCPPSEPCGKPSAPPCPRARGDAPGCGH